MHELRECVCVRDFLIFKQVLRLANLFTEFLGPEKGRFFCFFFFFTFFEQGGDRSSRRNRRGFLPVS